MFIISLLQGQLIEAFYFQWHLRDTILQYQNQNIQFKPVHNKYMVELKLTIVSFSGKSWPTTAKSYYIILDFIKFTCSVQGLPAGEYRLMYDGKQLDESRTFSQQNIKANSILLLTFKDPNSRIKSQPKRDKSIYQAQAVQKYLKQKQGVEQKMLRQHRSLINQQMQLSEEVLSRDSSEKSKSVDNQSKMTSQKDLIMRQNEILQKNQLQLKKLAQNQSNRIAQYQQKIYEYRQRQRRTLLQYADKVNKQQQIQKQRLINYAVQVNIHIKHEKYRLIKYQNEVIQQKKIQQEKQKLSNHQQPALPQLTDEQNRLLLQIQLMKKKQSIQVDKLKQIIQKSNKQYQGKKDKYKVSIKQKSKERSDQQKKTIRKDQSRINLQNLYLMRNVRHLQKQEQSIVLKQYASKNIQLRQKLEKKLSQNTKKIENQLQIQEKRLNDQINIINQSINLGKKKLQEFIKNANLIVDKKNINYEVPIKKVEQ